MLTDDCTEYIEGEWVRPTDDSEPWAVVTFAAEPSPETGHEGWCWWAMGQMGEASSIDDARAKAVAALERFAAERDPDCSECGHVESDHRPQIDGGSCGAPIDDGQRCGCRRKEQREPARGVAGDRCEGGNDCGRTGCPECQQ